MALHAGILSDRGYLVRGSIHNGNATGLEFGRKNKQKPSESDAFENSYKEGPKGDSQYSY